jgi:long-subunit acyl-CoA synthetase (AMP-forming)
LKLSKSTFIITHPGFIKSAMEAADHVGIPHSKIILVSNSENLPFITLPDLVKIGETAPEIVRQQFAPGEARTKVALLNFSSGTSGLPKGVLISHYNVIANVCQLFHMEQSIDYEGTVSNGCLPFFHSNSTPASMLTSSLWSYCPHAFTN